MNSQLELLAIQDQEAVKNTYYRYPTVTPHNTLYETYVEVRTIDDSVKLYKIDEVILYVIARFKWAPAWLVQQWFEVANIKNGYDQMEKYIKVGLVWAQASSTGVFLRPTKYLFNMMDVKENNYTEIPFNLLNHTCAEMQIVFDAMYGNTQTELWYFISKLQRLPAYHPLKIKVENDFGVPIFTEDEFRYSFNPEHLAESQNKLIQSINSGARWTEEFKDLSLLTLVTEDEKSKSGIYTQRPDLVIPSFRNNHAPQSIAIEMELSQKIGARYDKIMQSYKDNLIYGSVLYLCGNNSIVTKVKEAYQRAGGLGSCKLLVAPWAAPAQRIKTYSYEEEKANEQLISTTFKVSEQRKCTDDEIKQEEKRIQEQLTKYDEEYAKNTKKGE